MSGRRWTKSNDGVVRTTVRIPIRLDPEQFSLVQERAKLAEVKIESILLGMLTEQMDAMQRELQESEG